ncbi:conjugal transfer protein TraB [Vibrio ichthyoenteri ATCC 700023]|uniref:Conjugal transfer protein TraB n=1 Tax=Vibrio ichthyoenteri ATCC 700023 TaxID=870968 RepID=F9S7H6_9VIBR|nr:lytic transglycosylase domain-containing protein [Vibrio ichthyoenteri]EGU31272.1 conjugal transfer protein TraB [Vibrio ichthyoenteri ATCC 700023]
MFLEPAILLSLASECQTYVDTDVIQQLISIESSGNPYAIAVKGVPIVKQPDTLDEAIQSARQLDKLGFNFSVGLMQINHTNFDKTNLTIETAFDYCKNINAGSQIFNECHDRAKVKFSNKTKDEILNHAASCYYSGNFDYGFTKEGKNNVSYVDKFRGIKSKSKNTIKPKKQPENLSDKPRNTESWDVFGDFSN